MRRLLIFLLATSLFFSPVAGQLSLEVQLEQAFNALSDASSAGANVSILLDDFNNVLDRLGSGDYSETEVSQSLTQIARDANDLEVAAKHANDIQTAVVGIQVTLTLALVYLVYRFFPRLFWRTWLRFRGGWRVEDANR